MYTVFYKRFIDYYVIFEICLMAPKSARMRGSAHLKAVTVAHQNSYVIPSAFLRRNGYTPVFSNARGAFARMIFIY